MSVRLRLAIEQIVAGREYTDGLMRSIDDHDWFRRPFEGVTHVAWQVGHLAVAEYWLAVWRMRGGLPTDEKMLPKNFVELFGKGSQPSGDSTRYPALATIVAVFEAVHREALEVLDTLTDAELDETTTPAHKLFTTKLGAIQWCARHEMLHAGQIGLLRRLFGMPARW